MRGMPGLPIQNLTRKKLFIFNNSFSLFQFFLSSQSFISAKNDLTDRIYLPLSKFGVKQGRASSYFLFSSICLLTLSCFALMIEDALK